MNRNAEMPPARRRPMPGMAAGDQSRSSPQLAAMPEAPPTKPSPATHGPPLAEVQPPRVRSPQRRAPTTEEPRTQIQEKHRASDYGTTRLVNFRIPVDLHDRYKKLVRDIEEAHPRLRHPSLTELLIALLEEGPTTADQAAALIQRKRAAEHSPPC